MRYANGARVKTLITDEINKLAELNLCERCRPIYKAMIEPNIRRMTETALQDWARVESTVKGMCLRHMGISKLPNGMVEEIDESDLKSAEFLIDIEKYKKFKYEYSRFAARLKYLHDNGIVGDNLNTLLKKTSQRRNNIHKPSSKMLDGDRILYGICNSLIWYQASVLDKWVKGEIRDRVFKATENDAASYLRIFDEIVAVGQPKT